jgi:formylglycine-generating enzyme required for sulfatase activity
MAHDVFISYPHQDKAIADAACAKLEAEGIRCWVAPRDISPSADWAASIVSAIDSCRVMVLIFSAYANQSKQVHREVQRAFDGEKPVVPFRIENVPPEKSLAYYMGPVHWLDALTPPLDQHLQRLAASVQRLVWAPTPEQDDRHSPTAQEAKAKNWATEGRRRRLRRFDGPWAWLRSRSALVAGSLIGAVAIGAIGGLFFVRIPAQVPAVLSLERELALKPKDRFKECSDCPDMIVVPAGRFIMGSPASEEGHIPDEGPQHEVVFAREFAVGRFAVTFDEWDACVAHGGCSYKPDDQGWGRGRRPVIMTSWVHAQSYVAWLSNMTGKTYRLLTEAEREYVTRAGTATPFWWGSSISTSEANYSGFFVYGNGPMGEYRGRTVPVDSFAPNPWGLYQVHGNVWEWTEDCYHSSYDGAPGDGSAWTSGFCGLRVLRGGSFETQPEDLRSANRTLSGTESNSRTNGLRVARTLNTQ